MNDTYMSVQMDEQFSDGVVSEPEILGGYPPHGHLCIRQKV